MRVDRLHKKKKITAILTISIAVLVVFGLFIYLGLIKIFPDVVSDQQGIANNLAKKIFDSQDKYHNQNGVYAENLSLLEDLESSSEKYRIGYSKDFPKIIGSLCDDCVYQAQSYKLLITIKWLSGATIWTFSNTGELKQLKSIYSLPIEFRDFEK